MTKELNEVVSIDLKEIKGDKIFSTRLIMLRDTVLEQSSKVKLKRY